MHWPEVNLLCRMILVTHYFNNVQPRLGRGFNLADATAKPWLNTFRTDLVRCIE